MFDSVLKVGRSALLAVTLTSSVALGGMSVLAQDASPVPGTPVPYSAPENLGDMEGRISTDGSSTVGPITEAMAEEFTAEAGNIEMTVDISGTGGGFKRFCASDTDLQNASRPIKDEEKAICDEAGVKYYAFEVAYDGLSIVVNPENDWLTCITVADLQKLWTVGSEVDSWDDLNPEFPSEQINLYGAGTDSGTFDFFTKEINGEEGVAREDYTPSEDDNVLVEGVAGDKYALGFFGHSYYEENSDSLKLVAVDSGTGCIEPTVETIRDGSYSPLSRPLYVYVNAESLTRPEVQEFMRFYLANAGGIAGEIGFVASPDDVYFNDQAKLEGAIGGTVMADNEA